MKNQTQSRIVAAAFAAASLLPVGASADTMHNGQICGGKTGHIESCVNRVGKFCSQVSIDESCTALLLNRLRDGRGTLMSRQSDDPATTARCLDLFAERLLNGAE